MYGYGKQLTFRPYHQTREPRMLNQSMLQACLDYIRVEGNFASDNSNNVAIKSSSLEQTRRRTQWLLYLERGLAADGLSHLCLLFSSSSTSSFFSSLYVGLCFTWMFFKWGSVGILFQPKFRLLSLVRGYQGFNMWSGTLCWWLRFEGASLIEH